MTALLSRLPLVDDNDLERGRDWFERHGTASIFFGRFVPGVRSLVSIPAGVERMPFWRFLAFTTAGTLGWNLALVTLGYVLGSQWTTVAEYSDYINYAVYAALALLVVHFVWRRRDRIGRGGQGGGGGSPRRGDDEAGDGRPGDEVGPRPGAARDL